MIYIILGRFSKDTADNLALHPDDTQKRTAAQREEQIRSIVEHDFIGGALRHIYWTLGEFDVVISFAVTTAEKGAAAALALATQLGLSTTTLTAFETEALQDVMDDSGHAGYGHAGYGH